MAETEPIPPSRMRNIWEVAESSFMQRLQDSGTLLFQLEIIKAIKEVGGQVLGKNIRAVADYNGRRRPGTTVTLTDILAEYPTLSTALSESRITEDEISSGAKHIHYIDDPAGLESIAYLLPAHLKTGDGVLSLTPEQRVNLDNVELKEISLRADEIDPVVKSNWRLWNKLAFYFQLKIDERISTAEDFLTLAEKNGYTIVLLRCARQAFNFWVKEPRLIDHSGRDLGGKIEVHGVSLFQGATTEFPARVIVGYYVSRIWSKRSMLVVNEKLEELKEAV